MPAFEYHCEGTVSYKVLPAELEFPDSLHLLPDPKYCSLTIYVK